MTDINDKIERVINFCADLTRSYDRSHNVEHHKRVFNHAKNLLDQMQFEKSEYDFVLELIIFSSLLHDTIDRKYGAENKPLLVSFLNEHTKLSESVLWIIDNVSYSKEIKYGYPQTENKSAQLARDIVSDADKIDALGSVGIERMIQYSRRVSGLLSDEVLIDELREHSNEKLLHLRSFIRTEPGKAYADDLHTELAEILKSDEQLKSYIEKVDSQSD